MLLAGSFIVDLLIQSPPSLYYLQIQRSIWLFLPETERSRFPGKYHRYAAVQHEYPYLPEYRYQGQGSSLPAECWRNGWDTRNVVTFQSSLLRDLRSAASVAKSRALALSSRIRISGFFYQGTGNGKSLFLAAGKVFTVLFQHKIKLSRFTLYYLFSLCCGKCLP